jgi:DNA-binding response OmpR family regulator
MDCLTRRLSSSEITFASHSRAERGTLASMPEAAARVLVVEDNPDDAALVERALAASPRPYVRETVPRVATALQRLARGGIDVVLLDLGLPDADGFDGVNRIAADHPFVPVVVLTGLEDEEVGLRAVQVGAQDYLVKGSLDPRLLDRSLRYAIERKRAEQALARLASIMGGICFHCGRKLEPESGAGRPAS